MDLPEPLFEAHLQERQICLVCARRFATTVLRTTDREVVPLCADCAAEWNLYGYQILKRIRPGQLVQRLLSFKLRHPFQRPSWRTISRSLSCLNQWAGKMKRWT